jgi:hypothetical protein
MGPRDGEAPPEPRRCVIMVDRALPPGRAANAAAMVALTLGQRHPHLPGPELIDGSGTTHPGLIPGGIVVLAAEAPDLTLVRDKAVAAGVDVVVFPRQGQQTNDYAAVRAAVAAMPAAELVYVGVGLYGPRKAVGRIVGRYGLLR